MKVMGLRISDEKNGILDVMLSDFLEIIPDKSLYWRIVWSDVVFKQDVSDQVVNMQDKIDQDDNGLVVSWEELNIFASYIHQEIDFCLIGSKDLYKLHHYDKVEEMYQVCEVIVEAIDTSFWEVRTQDECLFKNIITKFKEIEVID